MRVRLGDVAEGTAAQGLGVDMAVGELDVEALARGNLRGRAQRRPSLSRTSA